MARLLMVLMLLAEDVALASPTANETQQCHSVSATMLQHCLDETPGSLHGPACWVKSRRSQGRFHDEVRASHQRPRQPPRPTPAPGAPTAAPAAPPGVGEAPG